MGDHVILGPGQVVREIVDARGPGHAGNDAPDNIIDMHAAEHLTRQIDTAGPALANPVEDAAAGAVNTRQAEDVDGAAERPPPTGDVSSTHAPPVSP